VNSSFQDAWQKFIQGDKGAFGEIYTSLFTQLVLFCLGMLKDEETAKNITSESLIKLHESVDSGTIDNPKAWLYTVCRNSCNTHWATTNRRAEILDDVGSRMVKVTQPEGQVKLEQEDYDLRVKETLNEDELKIWSLHLEGYDNKEISERLDLTAKTVANKKTMARQKLMQAFKHEQGA
jgi:RNA polymerase sigma factor (sigma-70 family)